MIVLANEVVEVPKLDLEVQKGDVAGVVQVETFLGAMAIQALMVALVIYVFKFPFDLNLQQLGSGEAFTLEVA